MAGNIFSQHIGGFKTGENAAREIRLEIPNFKFQTPNLITIEADLNKWFQSTNNIKISEHSICHSPSKLAMQFADNNATKFYFTRTIGL